jgi:hypothetical protein
VSQRQSDTKLLSLLHSMEWELSWGVTLGVGWESGSGGSEKFISRHEVLSCATAPHIEHGALRLSNVILKKWVGAASQKWVWKNVLGGSQKWVSGAMVGKKVRMLPTPYLLTD